MGYDIRLISGDVSGRIVGTEEARAFALAVLELAPGLAFDDAAETPWTLDDLLVGATKGGQGFWGEDTGRHGGTPRPLLGELDLGDFEQEVVAAVRVALSRHGSEAAEVEIGWSAALGGWVIDITPRRVGAAPVSIGCDRDQLLLSFGKTRLELWNHTDGPGPLEALNEYLPSIFGGDFEEAGSGEDGFARLRLPSGKTASVGRVRLPIPWVLRRRRRYASYS